MLKIRMQRTGRTNMPSFRIIVTEHTEGPKTGNIVEKVGTYNPKTKERNLNVERIKYWLSVGAKASGTMHNMLISAGVIEGKKVNVLPKKSPPKPAPTDLPAEASAQAGASRKEAAATAAPAAPVEAKEEPKEEIKEEAPVIETAEAKPADAKAMADTQE